MRIKIDTNKAQFDVEKRKKRRLYKEKKKQNKVFRKAMEQHWVRKVNKEKE